jgi:hypothetical protein
MLKAEDQVNTYKRMALNQQSAPIFGGGANPFPLSQAL